MYARIFVFSFFFIFLRYFIVAATTFHLFICLFENVNIEMPLFTVYATNAYSKIMVKTSKDFHLCLYTRTTVSLTLFFFYIFVFYVVPRKTDCNMKPVMYYKKIKTARNNCRLQRVGF